MNIKNALYWGRNKLNRSESKALDSEILLSHTLNKDRLFLYTNPDFKVSEKDLNSYKRKISRRARGEPIAYITGNKEFMGINFLVNPHVLIPRPETELLVEKAMKFIPDKKAVSVLDLCCGSGAIGLSLKKFKPGINLTLSDISDKALKVTQKNLKSLEFEAQVIKSDLFENIKDQYDLIVSNPPYISEEEYKTLDPSIIDFEPVQALRAQMEGYYFYDRIAKQIRDFLKPGGALVLEIGANQAAHVKELFFNQGFKNITVEKDYSGFDRIVSVLT